MKKSYRQGQILQLIRGRAITTQEDLAAALKECGVEATQVTLSRDIREMGLVKTAGGYRALQQQERPEDFAALASEFLWDVRMAQNQIVLRTAPGHASSVAVALDNANWPQVVGTLAGDDTVLVICPDATVAETVRVRLMALLKLFKGREPTSPPDTSVAGTRSLLLSS
jgi:transcriptional regulator of arginine metabolism